MSNDYERAVSTLWKDVRELRTDLRSVMSAIRDGAKEKVDETRECMSEAAEKKVERIKEAARAARKRSAEAYKDFIETIEERPMASLLTAIGIGMVVGGLLHWRIRK